MAVFVDWLTVEQTYPRGVPLVADRLIQNVDLGTGCIEWERYVGHQVEGSFGSSLRVRSDGHRVEVSGNPSRFNREENLFGVLSVGEGVAVFNALLEVLGLPPFTGEDATYVAARQLQGSGGGIVRQGAIIKRVDLTENLSAGSAESAARALHALRAMHYRNRAPVDYGTTLMWGGKGSRYSSFKYYLKAPEMRANRKRGEDKSEYWEQVLAFAESEGILRHEATLKAEFLRQNGLDRAEVWTGDVMREVMSKLSVHGRAEAAVNSWDRIAEQLMSLGYSESRAVHCQHKAQAFLAGADLRAGCHRTTFFRLRRDLLRVGIDIAAPLNVSALRFSVERIELRPTSMPQWYRAASERGSKLPLTDPEASPGIVAPAASHGP